MPVVLQLVEQLAGIVDSGTLKVVLVSVPLPDMLYVSAATGPEAAKSTCRLMAIVGTEKALIKMLAELSVPTAPLEENTGVALSLE